MSQADVRELAGLIRSVAEQRRYMHPWIDDKRFVAAGGKILHAVDTDVITFFAAPAQKSVASRLREGYAHIFPWDDAELSIALGYQLVDRLFYHIEGDHPLLVLPPLEQEIGRVLTGMTFTANKQNRAASRELLEVRDLVGDWHAEADTELLLRRLAEAAPTLLQLLVGRGGTAEEVTRLRRLLREVRVSTLDAALERGDMTEPELVAALRAPSDFRDRIRFSDLKGQWFDRLSETKSSTKSRLLVYDDAQVLARIEWVNEQLDHKRSHRLVLITGDAAIFDAAMHYQPLGAGHCFADLYLRHPRAYLGEPGVLAPAEEDRSNRGPTESELVDWLDTLLAAVDVRGTGYRDALDTLLRLPDDDLRERCAQVLAAQPEVLNEFRERWNRHTANLKVASLDELIGDLAQQLGKLHDDIRSVLARVEELLKDRVRETWDAYFEVATNLGYGLLWQRIAKRGMRARNPPALSYDTFKKARAFVQRVLAAREQGQWDRSYLDDLGALRSEDPTRYTYFLAFAVLFAAEGIWHVADLLAEKAMDLADEGKNPRISGREAAYMRAVARRHSARRIEDLDAVQPMLDEAYRRWRIDLQRRPELCAGEVRFAAEGPALMLTYHMFAHFLGYALPSTVPRLDDVQRQCIDLLADVDTLLGAAQARDENSERLRWIAKSVERKLLTNVFSIALLQTERGEEGLDERLLRACFKRFSDNIENFSTGGTALPGITPSFLVRAVYMASAWCMTDERTEKRRLRRELESLLSDPAINDGATFPYGRQRFRHLRDLVCDDGSGAGR